ncbi:hypothetical protein TGPRC2_243465 [Toxoplasma gondii TgCatPRC2]|uniref:Uncharacterized protein n=14 Tax=Toxoplasma gondii TaxID=5811 RepID=A0A125YXE5_TOXGV|nr:hypothetical protein TGME49_243465 [Toxoplasma gondii ME49]EPR56547.1 hypothetical protein TGGT1_243465 [Toxoplasma gondii GT1]ESS31687.1 hypothetical protein TGVEG_243465 [Toxoplasma gondii VEG]KFG33090.1 hypothetical protein TGDOM2_243465 [Toxoplasma gondii GAB2-2007-GAL-DOM2]KFG34267.1 hypothetical protein TGP89_243465 [Toxoplasma gondii p89]KFG51429.1 hypothetical protein TGFOU_243465 [Toxoplasma gondii FOU]KFG60229.1 hypothetical protein TGRUB_243465 [Toxoplasma gondii RUB]KFH04811.1|eukprot:XP_018637511.1 hypothetical protein TGME49_243465 [Toxoplasma gondii ME49]
MPGRYEWHFAAFWHRSKRSTDFWERVPAAAAGRHDFAHMKTARRARSSPDTYVKIRQVFVQDAKRRRAWPRRYKVPHLDCNIRVVSERFSEECGPFLFL